MRVWLFVAQETSAYALGNALAILEPESQETEIRTFEQNLRKVIGYLKMKQGRGQVTDKLQ